MVERRCWARHSSESETKDSVTFSEHGYVYQAGQVGTCAEFYVSFYHIELSELLSNMTLMLPLRIIDVATAVYYQIDNYIHFTIICYYEHMKVDAVLDYNLFVSEILNVYGRALEW